MFIKRRTRFGLATIAAISLFYLTTRPVKGKSFENPYLEVKDVHKDVYVYPVELFITINHVDKKSFRESSDNGDNGDNDGSIIIHDEGATQCEHFIRVESLLIPSDAPPFSGITYDV